LAHMVSSRRPRQYNRIGVEELSLHEMITDSVAD